MRRIFLATLIVGSQLLGCAASKPEWAKGIDPVDMKNAAVIREADDSYVQSIDGHRIANSGGGAGYRQWLVPSGRRRLEVVYNQPQARSDLVGAPRVLEADVQAGHTYSLNSNRTPLAIGFAGFT